MHVTANDYTYSSAFSQSSDVEMRYPVENTRTAPGRPANTFDVCLAPAGAGAQGPAYVPNQAAVGTRPDRPASSGNAARGLQAAGFVTGAISIILAPFGILSVASNDPRWHNNAVKYSCGTLSIVFGVVSVGLGFLGCCLGARQNRDAV